MRAECSFPSHLQCVALCPDTTLRGQCVMPGCSVRWHNATPAQVMLPYWRKPVCALHASFHTRSTARKSPGQIPSIVYGRGQQVTACRLNLEPLDPAFGAVPYSTALNSRGSLTVPWQSATWGSSRGRVLPMLCQSQRAWIPEEGGFHHTMPQMSGWKKCQQRSYFNTHSPLTWTGSF